MQGYPDKMTNNPGRTDVGAGSAEAPRIVISGLDEPEAREGESVNASPTDEAIERLQRHRERGEPEDEDG